MYIVTPNLSDTLCNELDSCGLNQYQSSKRMHFADNQITQIITQFLRFTLP